MFGLENQKKKKKFEEFVFPLEQDLKMIKKHQEVKTLIEGRIQAIKDNLRNGENPEDFGDLGTILHGYTSLLKVLSRFKPR
jgi:hypothetical protein